MIKSRDLLLRLGNKYNELLNNFIVKHEIKLKNKKIEKYMKLYNEIVLEGEKYISFARFSGVHTHLKTHGINCTFINTIKPPGDIELGDDELDLEPHQVISRDYLIQNIYSPESINNCRSSCTFVMETGQGKSFVAMSIIKHLRGRTIIILPGGAALEDWENYLRDTFPDATIGFYCTGRPKTFGDIIIMIVNSAIKERFKFVRDDYTRKHLDAMRAPDDSITIEQLTRVVKLVVLDEIHDYCTDERQNVFWNYGLTAILGITATPEHRVDKMDIVFHKHVGKLVHAKDIPGINLKAVTWSGKVFKYDYIGSPEYTRVIPGTVGVDYIETVKMIARDPDRNDLIKRIILREHTNGRYIFVFALHKDILKTLYDLLEKHIPGDVSFLTGDSDDTAKSESRGSARVILTTYSYTRQSVSIPRMDTIIFAQPRKTGMQQIIGRILRLSGDASITRHIHDIVDIRTGLAKQYSSRAMEYKRREFEITRGEL